MLWVGIAADRFHLTTDASRRGVPRVIFCESTVNLLQLSIVNVSSESLFDCL
jgi:hypothetical protein